MSRARVLVVDDKANIRNLLQKVLVDWFEVTMAEDGDRALAMIMTGDFDVVVTDIKMPGADGLTVLQEVKRTQPEVEVILMTAYGSASDAVKAMKEGAYDYLTKPFDPEEALLIVQRAAERKRLREQARDLRSAIEGSQRFDKLVGKSPAMQRVFDLMRRAAATDATVLITGTSGTGKELVARAIHLASARSQRRFVPVNCGAIPETLLESELFGHVKGSFTGAVSEKRGLFEEADDGTLLLDEIGEFPLALQVKLTRALQEHAIRRVGGTQERKINVRVIAATNVDLKRAVAAGSFREDLFYRLNIFPIHLPPLRERREDIPMLAALFLERHGQLRNEAPAGFTADALTALVRYDWPGNVRELENAIERAIAVCDGPRIDVRDLPELSGVAYPGIPTGNITSLSYHEVLNLTRDRVSREYLVALMRESGGNVTQAAGHAGVKRESLHRLLKRYRVLSDDFKKVRG